MIYTKPTYIDEAIESNDVILASINLGGGVILTETAEVGAQVGASVLDVLGLR